MWVLDVNCTVGVGKAAGRLLWNHVTIPPKITNRSIEAENGCAARRTQRGGSYSGRATSGRERALAPKSSLFVDLRGGRQNGNGRIRNGEVAKGKESVERASTHHGSQEAPKVVHAIG